MNAAEGAKQTWLAGVLRLLGNLSGSLDNVVVEAQTLCDGQGL